MAALSVTGRLLGFARILILARLLGPRDFGLVGIALVVTGLLEAVTSTGTDALLIHRQARARALFDTAWTLAAARGVLVAALLAAAAVPVAAFFGAPEAAPLVGAMALVPLLAGLVNVGVVEFRRDLALGRHYAIHVAGVVADLGAAVAVAAWRRDAWALVAGAVALTAARLAASYALHPYRPRLRADRAQLREVFAFGRWVSATRTMQWLLAGGVPGVVGRVAGVPALGLYEMSWRVASAPALELAHGLSAVTVTAYASLRQAPARLGAGFRRVLSATALVAVPAAAVLAVHGRDVVVLLLGPAWHPAVPVLQALALAALARAVAAAAGPLFDGLGRPRTATGVQLLELAVVALLVVPLARRWGAAGAAVAVGVGATAGAAAGLAAAGRATGTSAGALLRVLAGPALACLPLVAVQRLAVGPRHSVAGLAAALGLSAALYAASLALLHRGGVLALDPSVLGWVGRRGPAPPEPGAPAAG
jgi:O-antigen/teichoic acid export membrane protein